MNIFRTVALALVWATLAAMTAIAGTPELYGRATGLDRPSLSPSGRFLAVECAPKGVPAVCIFDLEGKSENRFIPVGSEYRLQGHYWPNDAFLIMEVSEFESVQTNNGQKEYDFQRAISYDLATGQASMLLRDEYGVLDTQGVVSVLPEDDDAVLISTVAPNTASSSSSLGSVIPDRGGVAWTLATFRTDLKTGKSRRTESFAPGVEHVWFDAGGKVVAKRVRPNRRSDTVELRSGGKTLLSYSTRGASEFQVLGLDPTTGKLVVFNDLGEQDGLHFMSLETGRMEPIMLADTAVGRARSIRDTYTRSIVGFSYYDGLEDQHFIDPVLKEAHEALKQVLPDKRVSLVSWSRDKVKMVVRAESAGRPADFYVYDRARGQLGPVGSSASHMASVETGTVSARRVVMRDGLEIEVMLTLPPDKSEKDGPFPTLIMPHGGPEARDGMEYDWWTQAYAAEGYMVLQPNFRGSDGYGQALRNAGFGEFGGRMIDDIADTGAWAVEQGLVKSGRYCVIGASYGGYAALMAGLEDEDRTACAVSVNGVTDPFRLIARYEVGRETHDYWERYIGSNRYSSEAERAAISPLSRAGEFSLPVMLLYGEEDLVVPTNQTEQLASALEGHEPLEIISLGAEDHYLSTSRVRNAVLTNTLDFLGAHHPAE